LRPFSSLDEPGIRRNRQGIFEAPQGSPPERRAAAGANRKIESGGQEGTAVRPGAKGLNLDGTELVVPSACNSAKGAVDYSEGVFGLARALHTAGTRASGREDAAARSHRSSEASSTIHFTSSSNGIPA
jgi:hypothetical protein